MYKEALMVMAAGGVGAAVTYGVQKMVEPTTPTLVPQLGGFGRTSAVVGIGVGAVALAAALYGMKTGAIVRDPRHQYALMAFGGASLVSGLLVGMGGMSAASRAFPRTAAVRAVPAGGYSQINKRDQNIL